MKNFKNIPLLLTIVFLGGIFVACSDDTDTSTYEDDGPAEVADYEEDVDATDESDYEESAGDDEGDTEVAVASDYEDSAEDYGPAEFTLVNDTDRPLLEFYVSPPSEESWGEDLIPEDMYVVERAEIQVVIDDGREDCAYDILGVFGPSPDGSVGEGELIQSDVEICDGTTYVYSQG